MLNTNARHWYQTSMNAHSPLTIKWMSHTSTIETLHTQTHHVRRCNSSGKKLEWVANQIWMRLMKEQEQSRYENKSMRKTMKRSDIQLVIKCCWLGQLHYMLSHNHHGLFNSSTIVNAWVLVGYKLITWWRRPERQCITTIWWEIYP